MHSYLDRMTLDEALGSNLSEIGLRFGIQRDAGEPDWSLRERIRPKYMAAFSKITHKPCPYDGLRDGHNGHCSCGRAVTDSKLCATCRISEPSLSSQASAWKSALWDGDHDY